MAAGVISQPSKYASGLSNARLIAKAWRQAAANQLKSQSATLAKIGCGENQRRRRKYRRQRKKVGIGWLAAARRRHQRQPAISGGIAAAASKINISCGGIAASRRSASVARISHRGASYACFGAATTCGWAAAKREKSRAALLLAALFAAAPRAAW
jgi:hypothetical protein